MGIYIYVNDIYVIHILVQSDLSKYTYVTRNGDYLLKSKHVLIQ